MTKAKDVDVTVVLTPSQDPKWHLRSTLLQGGKLVFQNNGHPGFNVFFKIEDPEGSGYQFPDNANMALAATPLAGPGTECPDQGTKWNQFNPVNVTKDKNGRNTTLEVNDPNAPGQSCDFGYSLFVTLQPDGSGGPSSYWKLDPIGSNQNGPQFDGGEGFMGMSLPVLVGGAILLLAAIYALYRFNVFG